MKKFLASVGNAQLLGKKNGELYHIADIRTLTESSLSFSNSMEEVRAGEGAQLYGRFSHDSGMTITLTDAMFDMNYIGLQIGAEIEGNAMAFASETFNVVESGTVTVKKEPQSIGRACGLDKKVAWVRAKGCGADVDWVATTEINGNVITVPTTIDVSNGVCVRYFENKPEARQLSISSNFIPAECILILTTKLFAGDANAPETGKPIGEITVKIPRFSLDGNFDLSMAMSSASNTNLSGTALAVEDGGCEGKGIYAEIVEVTTGTHAITGLKSVVLDPDDNTTIWGMYFDGHISALLYDANTTTAKLIDTWTENGTEHTVTGKILSSSALVVHDDIEYWDEDGHHDGAPE